MEIESLKEELKKVQIELASKECETTEACYPCNSCDFVGVNKEAVTKHIENDHEFICKLCEFESKTEHKLNSHICILHLNNPSYINFYLKNWIVYNGCHSVFCNNLKKEMAILHNDPCFHIDSGFASCDDLPLHHNETPLKSDKHGIVHLPLTTYITDGEVSWPELRKEIKLT